MSVDYDVVLAKIMPEDVSQIVEEMVLVIQKHTSGEVFPGGSYAKGTHIGKAFDCDIFVRFESGDVSAQLLASLTKVSEELKTDIVTIHGSRDYYQLSFKDIAFEFVPVLKIDDPDDAENIMDVSPFHVTWVAAQLAKKDVSKDIRLMKQFLKACYAYGAESYIAGFSGHVVDLMVLHYGSFEETITALKKWSLDEKTTIDYENEYKGKDVLFYLNSSKTQGPLVIVDPIMPDRNAAAAVGDRAFMKAVLAAKAFSKTPAETFFEIVPLTTEIIETRFSVPVASVSFTSSMGKSDVVGAKLRKVWEYVEAQLKENGFTVVDSEWAWDASNVSYWFGVESLVIPKNYSRKGPENAMEQAVAAFCAEHPNAYEKDGIWFVDCEREIVDAQAFVEKCMKDPYVLERI
jgi:tRNA nucleotidyltransferase (CCA-adding enzyme)